MVLGVSLLAVSLAGVKAGTPLVAVEEAKDEKSVFDKLWSIPVIYKNADNDIIQQVAFIGRYHGNAWALEADDYGSETGWDNRRARLGLKVDFAKRFTFDFNVNVKVDWDEDGRFIQNFEEIRLIYKIDKKNRLYLGRVKTHLTDEWWDSSNSLDIIERSLLVNQVVHGKLWGVSADGQIGNILYSAGIFSASVDTDWNTPTFDGGAVFYGGIGYAISDAQSVRLDYAYLSEDAGNNATRPYEHVATLNYDGQWDAFGVSTNLIYGKGQGTTPDVYGLIITPTYEIIENKLVGVLRYQYATGDGNRPVSLQSRYEREAPELPTRYAEDYNAIYGGLNYLIYGHKLKLQAGVEYSHANLANGEDYDAFTFLGGIRFSF